MHTIEFHDIASDENGPERTGDLTRFHYHGGYSGNVVVMRQVNGQISEMNVPFEHMKALVAQYVAHAHIRQIEKATDDQILGVKP